MVHAYEGLLKKWFKANTLKTESKTIESFAKYWTCEIICLSGKVLW